MVLRMLRRISDRLGVAIDEEESDRTAQLTKETDVLTIAEQLREELPAAERRYVEAGLQTRLCSDAFVLRV